MVEWNDFKSEIFENKCDEDFEESFESVIVGWNINVDDCSGDESVSSGP